MLPCSAGMKSCRHCLCLRLTRNARLCFFVPRAEAGKTERTLWAPQSRTVIQQGWQCQTWDSEPLKFFSAVTHRWMSGQALRMLSKGVLSSEPHRMCSQKHRSPGRIYCPWAINLHSISPLNISQDGWTTAAGVCVRHRNFSVALFFRPLLYMSRCCGCVLYLHLDWMFHILALH